MAIGAGDWSGRAGGRFGLRPQRGALLAGWRNGNSGATCIALGGPMRLHR